MTTLGCFPELSPGLGFSPELESEAPGFVVIYDGVYPGPVLQTAADPGETPAAARKGRPGFNDACVIVDGQMTVYENVPTG
ncbi:MAG: hypothetical protein H0X16_07845 [Chloroflexi bacterium]|nr:hypothetical protein [Chloroflexota bacterium]